MQSSKVVGKAPTGVVNTGIPCDIASITTLGEPSDNEGKKNKSDSLIFCNKAFLSSIYPYKITLLDKLFSHTNFFKSSNISPAPTISNLKSTSSSFNFLHRCIKQFIPLAYRI